MKYQFEQFELDTEKLELTCLGEPVRQEPQVFALIELLVTNADRVVSKDEINERVGGGELLPTPPSIAVYARPAKHWMTAVSNNV